MNRAEQNWPEGNDNPCAPIELPGTNTCIRCEREFTAENPCCCDYALNDDGTHVDGVCRECCQDTREIDIKNLRFYAAMAKEFGWQTDVIHVSVIAQTLTEIADRLSLMGLRSMTESVWLVVCSPAANSAVRTASGLCPWRGAKCTTKFLGGDMGFKKRQWWFWFKGEENRPLKMRRPCACGCDSSPVGYLSGSDLHGNGITIHANNEKEYQALLAIFGGEK